MNLYAKILKTRWLVRMPIGIFRVGLGFLMGNRLLMLEHKGRKSGEARYVILEVVSKPSKNSRIVASGFGRKSQWFQNILAEPHCFVSTGLRRRVPSLAVVLSSQEAENVLEAYRTNHPKLWAKLDSAMTEIHNGADYELPLVKLTFG